MNNLHIRLSRWIGPVVAFLALGAAGCDGLLEESPVGITTPEGVYQNAGDALTALSGAYQILHDNSYFTGRNYIVMLEWPTPQTTAVHAVNHERGCWDNYTCIASNPYPWTSWQAMYRGIKDANVVIDNVPGIESMDAGLRERVVAEAKVLRALHHFNLVRLFGGVPIQRNAVAGLNDLAQPRATADEVYAFIIEDLTAAEEHLPLSYPATEFGRITRGAAQALLGKVYLQRGVIGQSNPFGEDLYWPTAQPTDLSNAIAAFREVIESNQYELVADYGDLWNQATEQNSEVIWSIQNIAVAGQGMEVHNFLNPRDSGWGNEWTSANGELPFWQSYPEDDPRRDVTWLTEFVDTKGEVRKFDPDNVSGDTYPGEGPSPRKYLIESNVGVYNGNPKDLLLLRYADVLLMLAEALNEQNQGPSSEAYALIDRVRARSGLEPVPSGLSYDEFREQLYHERQWELSLEQQSWYDAPRFWDLFQAQVVAHSRLGITSPEQYPLRTVPQIEISITDPKHRLMPIPESAIDRNDALTQNPGY